MRFKFLLIIGLVFSVFLLSGCSEIPYEYAEKKCKDAGLIFNGFGVDSFSCVYTDEQYKEEQLKLEISEMIKQTCKEKQ